MRLQEPEDVLGVFLLFVDLRRAGGDVALGQLAHRPAEHLLGIVQLEGRGGLFRQVHGVASSWGLPGPRRSAGIIPSADPACQTGHGRSLPRRGPPRRRAPGRGRDPQVDDAVRGGVWSPLSWDNPLRERLRACARRDREGYIGGADSSSAFPPSARAPTLFKHQRAA